MIDISVILPSRGRWESLRRTLTSLMAGGDDAGVEVIVGLDDDDPASEATWILETYGNVRAVISPRQPSQGALFNLLAKEAAGTWLIPFPDDYVIDQPDWALKLRETLAMMPKGLGVAYFKDPMYPHFATFPIVSKRMVEIAGFFMPDFFPFLFGDTWWNEIGVMSAMIYPSEVSVSITTEHGHEHNYKDLAFWTELFQKTRPIREDIAMRALNEVFTEKTEEWGYLITTVAERSVALTKLQQHFCEPETIKRIEAMGTHAYANPRYAGIKARAERFFALQ